MKYWIGIDPGFTGAVAIMEYDTKAIDIQFWDAPVGQIGNKNVLLPTEMKRIFDSYKQTTCHIAIESVHSMKGQGVTSAFTFGKGVGLWIGVIVGLGLPYTEVLPQRWKAVMMHGMGKDKDASRVRAMQLFPQISEQLNLKKHHGRADALLLAEYIHRQG